MPISRTRIASLALAVLIVVVVALGGAYLHRQHRPLAGPSAGAPPNILNELPAAAPVRAYIDVAALRKLQGSPLAAMLGLAGADPKQDQDYRDFVKATGFDYARDLDAAAIAVWPSGEPTPGGGLGENPVVAIGDGRFDQQKIEAYALRTGKLVTRGTQTIYDVPGNPPVAFEFLSPARIALASGPDAENSVADRKRSALDPPAAPGIERVAGAPIFAVARTDRLPKNFYDNFKNSPQLETLARSVIGLTFAGQPQGDRIDLALDAECDSLTHAAELAALLDTFRILSPMALSDPRTRSQITKEQAAFLAALASEVKITHQDRWVRLTLAVTPQMLGLTNVTHAELR